MLNSYKEKLDMEIKRRIKILMNDFKIGLTEAELSMLNSAKSDWQLDRIAKDILRKRWEKDE